MNVRYKIKEIKRNLYQYSSIFFTKIKKFKLKKNRVLQENVEFEFASKSWWAASSLECSMNLYVVWVHAVIASSSFSLRCGFLKSRFEKSISNCCTMSFSNTIIGWEASSLYLLLHNIQMFHIVVDNISHINPHINIALSASITTLTSILTVIGCCIFRISQYSSN